MDARNTLERWSAVQQAFHGTIAVLVIAQLVVGFWFADLPKTDPLRGNLFGIHYLPRHFAAGSDGDSARLAAG